ncbi:MAG: hypothetical protein GX321_08245 [Clostridiales bacterium]|nr:hypothetical protein [Clostridiales bacterium]
MKKNKAISYIFAISFIALIILVFFVLGRSQKEGKLKEASLEKLTEVQQVLAMDFDKEYPKTPRDVAKLHGDMTRLLYSGLEDEEIKDLAIKIRELCDKEFLSNNPEETYLNELYSDLSLWNKFNRKIEHVYTVNKDKEENYEIDGSEYATAYISFTIVERGKTSELRQYIMRKSGDNKWMVLGWNVIPQD